MLGLDFAMRSSGQLEPLGTQRSAFEVEDYATCSKHYEDCE